MHAVSQSSAMMDLFSLLGMQTGIPGGLLDGTPNGAGALFSGAGGAAQLFEQLLGAAMPGGQAAGNPSDILASAADQNGKDTGQAGNDAMNAAKALAEIFGISIEQACAVCAQVSQANSDQADKGSKDAAPGKDDDSTAALTAALQGALLTTQNTAKTQTAATNNAAQSQPLAAWSTADHAATRKQTAGNANATASRETGHVGASRTWHIGELSHQIHRALQGMSVPAEAPTSGIVDPIHNGNASNDQKAMSALFGSAKQAAAMQAAPHAAAKAKATAPALNENAADPSVSQPQASSTAQPIEWHAQVSAHETSSDARPSLTEQIRQVSDFLGERVDGVIRMNQKSVEANLKLYPPDLGQVRVELTVQNDRSTQATFIVERPETAQLLQQNLQTFQDGLSRHGLVVDRVQVNVQVSPSSGGQESAWRQGDTGQDRRESAWTSGRQDRQNRGGQPWQDPEQA